MALRKGTPGEGSEKRFEQFSFQKTPPGEKNRWHGWVACDPYWCRAHTSENGSKPCLHWMTSGQLSCPRCHPGKPTTDIGYVALYRATDLKACVVIVHDSTADLLEGVTYRTHVSVSREFGETSSVAVRKTPEQPPFRSGIKCRQSPADIAPSLLTMWRIPELNDWYVRTNKGSNTPVSLPGGIAVRSDGKPYSPAMQAAAKRYAPSTVQPSSVDEVIDEERKELARRVNAQPGRNGDHKPKG